MERNASLSTDLQNMTEDLERLRKSKTSAGGTSSYDPLEALKEEYSKRLGAQAKQLAAVVKERDELKKASASGDQAKTALLLKAKDDEIAAVRKAKDDEIAVLRQEGTNLSLKILNLESALKKHRATKKEDDATIASLKERLTQAEALVEKRNERVKQLEASEKKYLGISPSSPPLLSPPVHFFVIHLSSFRKLSATLFRDN